MDSILIASHSDLLVYDPLFINDIVEKNGNKLNIFIPNINRLDLNTDFKKKVKKYKLNIHYIPDVEANKKLISELFNYIKKFIDNNNIDRVYICNPIRIHCYIAFLAAYASEKSIPFIYYQGSLSTPAGDTDHFIYRSLNKSNLLRFLVKSNITFTISRLIFFIRQYFYSYLIYKSSLSILKEQRLNLFYHYWLLFKNIGIPINGLVAHDDLGLISMLKNIPSYLHSTVKRNVLILSNHIIHHKENDKSIDTVYFLPSLINDESLHTSKQLLLALDKWFDLLEFIQREKPKIKIYAKLHPRCTSSLSSQILNRLDSMRIEVLPSYITLDQFLKPQVLALTDMSTILSYCQLNGVRAISYQSYETCFYCYYCNKMPTNFTISDSIIRNNDDLLNLLQ